MSSQLLLFILLILLIAFYKMNIFKIFYVLIKKKKLKDYFDLNQIKREISTFHKRETILYFYCEKIISTFYSKLTIFNKDYNLKEKNIIKIIVNKNEFMDSDFTEEISLISENGDKVNFAINVCYNMNNYYQLILDKLINPLSLEIVLFSKNNIFPKLQIRNNYIIKEYGDNIIPNLKRYNLINISKKDFFKMYNGFCSNKLKNKNKFLLEQINSLFVNFIIKDNKKCEGRIFELKNESKYEDFTNNEIELLNSIKLLITIFTSKAHLIPHLISKMKSYYDIIVRNKNSLIKSIIEKISGTNYFNKYFDKKINKEILDLFDSSIFIQFAEERGLEGINFFIDYLNYKKNLFSVKFEFNNFEKLMILINLKDLILNAEYYEFKKLYDLPHTSPFIESEKIFLDIIKNINENSGLYFLYLQINSSSGLDYNSLQTWFKIKYIPLIKIKAHLIFNRYLFFFTFKKDDNPGAFVNPQNLIINFNIYRKMGYYFNENLENEKNINNTVKVLFYKFHESAHSKLDCGIKNSLSSCSPRYMLNLDLKPLDTYHDKIVKFKKGRELKECEKKGIDIGEEGYGLEMFLYNSFILTDILLKSTVNLKEFTNVNLYAKDNFKELNALFVNLITNIIGTKSYKKEKKRFNNIKTMDIRKTDMTRINNNEDIKKTPIYFFNNYPFEFRY